MGKKAKQRLLTKTWEPQDDLGGVGKIKKIKRSRRLQGQRNNYHQASKEDGKKGVRAKSSVFHYGKGQD